MLVIMFIIANLAGKKLRISASTQNPCYHLLLMKFFSCPEGELVLQKGRSIATVI